MVSSILMAEIILRKYIILEDYNRKSMKNGCYVEITNFESIKIGTTSIFSSPKLRDKYMHRISLLDR